MIDIDKDGIISNEDLETCLKNIESQALYLDGAKGL